MNEFLRRARLSGWTATHTNGGHLKLSHPEAASPVFVSATASDQRALRNAAADLRRALPRAPKPVVVERKKLPPRAPRPKKPPRPRQQEVERAIEWQAPPPERPRKPVPGGPRPPGSSWRWPTR